MDAHTLDPQHLARSCHEALILAILADGPRHGYQLALEIDERSEGFFRLNHGTLYPILHKLEARSVIDGKWDESTGKRRRRQYVLTAEGEKHLDSLRQSWSAYLDAFFRVIGRSSS